MPFQPSTPGDGYVKDGKPYVFTDTKGSAVPAMRDPATRKWVPDQGAMATGGMAQIGSKVAAPEDDAALKTMLAGLPQKQFLAEQSREFMDRARDLPTGPRYGHLPVLGGDAQSALRAKLAARDPATESHLEELEAINNQAWTAMRPPGSGPIRGFEATGWKTAFPSIVNMGPANKTIAQRLEDEYAAKTNEATFAQDFVHGGKGGVPAATAAFAQTLRTPNAAGRKQVIGAAPGDFSRKAPGWSQQLPPRQLAAAKLYANSNQPRGSKGNPLLYSPGVPLPPEAWVIDDDGGLVQMPKAGGRR